MSLSLWVAIGIIIIIFGLGIRIVRPTHRGLIERLGKYCKFGRPGFHWIIPAIDQMYNVNITERMIDAKPRNHYQRQFECFGRCPGLFQNKG